MKSEQQRVEVSRSLVPGQFNIVCREGAVAISAFYRVVYAVVGGAKPITETVIEESEAKTISFDGSTPSSPVAVVGTTSLNEIEPIEVPAAKKPYTGAKRGRKPKVKVEAESGGSSEAATTEEATTGVTAPETAPAGEEAVKKGGGGRKPDILVPSLPDDSKKITGLDVAYFISRTTGMLYSKEGDKVRIIRSFFNPGLNLRRNGAQEKEYFSRAQLIEMAGLSPDDFPAAEGEERDKRIQAAVVFAQQQAIAV